MSHVWRLAQVGWTLSDLSPDFIPYLNRCHELSVLVRCGLWSSHVIPPTGHDIILNNSMKLTQE